jgi:hypothetical protein
MLRTILECELSLSSLYIHATRIATIQSMKNPSKCAPDTTLQPCVLGPGRPMETQLEQKDGAGREIERHIPKDHDSRIRAGW